MVRDRWDYTKLIIKRGLIDQIGEEAYEKLLKEQRIKRGKRGERKGTGYKRDYTEMIVRLGNEDKFK